jgi:hypothetical protein
MNIISRILKKIWRNTFAREYAIPFLVLLLLVSIFLYRSSFRGEILIPSDLLNVSRQPWSSYFDNSILEGRAINIEQGDAALIAQPFKYFVKDAIFNGTIPFWYPYSFCGYSFQQRIMSQVLNPTGIFYILFPLGLGTNFTLTLHLVLAGFFVFLLLRSLKAGFIPSYLAAVIFMFNANSILWLEFLTHLKVELYIPLVVMFFYKGLETKRFRFIAISALLLGLQINSGNPQTPQYTAILLGFTTFTMFLFGLWGKDEFSHLKNKLNDRFFPIYSLISCVFIALLIGAAFIWPFYKDLGVSIRSEQDRSLAEGIGRWFSYLTTFIFPKIFYQLKENGDIFGNGTELIKYSGTTAFLLAPLALISRKKVFSISLIIMVLFSLLTALSIHFRNALVTLVPILKFGNPTRMLAMIPFCLAVLSGLGLDALITNLKGSKERFLALFLISVSFIFWSVCGLVSLHQLGYGVRSAINEPSVMVFAVIFLISFVLIILVIFRRKIIFFGKLSLLFLLIFEVFFYGINLNMTTPAQRVYFSTPGIDKIISDDDKFRIITLGGVLPANTNVVYGLESAEGYDPLLPQRYADFINMAKNAGQSGANGKASIRIPYQRLLNLLNVKYILSGSYFLPSGPIYHDFSIQNVISGDIKSFVKTTWDFQEHYIPVIEVPASSRFEMNQYLPESSTIEFYIATNPESWIKREGDGVIFKILIKDGDKEIKIYERKIDAANEEKDRRWFYENVDLSRWSNKEVSIIFETDAGDNTLNDLPAWGNPRIVPINNVDTIQLVYDDEIKIYKNFDVFPRASLYYNSEVHTDINKIVNRLFNDDFDLSKILVLESGKEIDHHGNLLNREVKILSYSPNRILISANAEDEAYLLLLDAYDDQWRAFVDGEPVKIERANYYFRAVLLNKGQHIIEFKYFPKDFLQALPVTVIGLCAAIVIASFSSRWRKR